MPPNALRILVVGATIAGTEAVLEQLQRRGWGAHDVARLSEAKDVLRTIRFDVVLAAEHLPDGSGYDLAEDVARRGRTLLVGVTLSESGLWLPVVMEGARTLGERAINQHTLQSELEYLLLSSAKKRAGDETEFARRASAKLAMPPRRKSADPADRSVGSGIAHPVKTGGPLSINHPTKSIESRARARSSKQ